MKKILSTLFLTLLTLIACAQTFPQGSNVLQSNGYLNGLGYVWNLTPGSLPNWRKALANVRDNTGNARIGTVGDSTMLGYGSTAQATYGVRGSWPARLAQAMSGRMGNTAAATPALAVNGVAIPANSSAHDSRWVLGTGWSQAGFGFAGTSCFTGTAPTGNLVFTPDPTLNCDRFAVYWLKLSAGGQINATATGGSSTPIVTAGASGMGMTVVSAAAAATTNTLSMVGNADAKAVYVFAVEPYLSATSQVLVGNMGSYGAQTSTWTGGSNWYGLQAIAQYNNPNAGAVNCNLWLVSLGINDANSSVSVSTYIANMTTIVNQCKDAGAVDVVLVSWPPSTGAGYITYESLYLPALQQLSTSLNVPLIDISSRWGNTYQAGLMADSLHPNDLGYWDIASAVSNVLLGGNAYAYTPKKTFLDDLEAIAR